MMYILYSEILHPKGNIRNRYEFKYTTYNVISILIFYTLAGFILYIINI